MLLRNQELIPCIPEEVLPSDNRKELIVPKCLYALFQGSPLGIPGTQKKI